MLIICHHPPRHITGGVFGLQRGLDYIHKSVCKDCKEIGTVTLVPGEGFPLTQNYSQRGRATPLMQFRCNGYEPFGFISNSLWRAERPTLLLHFRT
ncbi:UPF0587 protein [Artemisia annua]|uniref:UPF0587 protein n=1 Tax=Artemisia annua TaxID=35608 RepID=A0A2U1P0X6_ARTAN|nr:UPF0587 protein [Artemisia annua]